MTKFVLPTKIKKIKNTTTTNNSNNTFPYFDSHGACQQTANVKFGHSGAPSRGVPTTSLSDQVSRIDHCHKGQAAQPSLSKEC